MSVKKGKKGFQKLDQKKENKIDRFTPYLLSWGINGREGLVSSASQPQ